MGREVRRVPMDWQHPKDERGHYRPLLEITPLQHAERRRKWDEGFRCGYGDDEPWVPRTESDGKQFEDYYGDAPDEDRMPDFSPGTAIGYCMYETTSEGTPISPVFATPEELARWLADTRASAFEGEPASYEGWLRVARGGFAPSCVMQGGVLMSGVDGL